MTEETKDTQKQPIWVNPEKCKSCGLCVPACIPGVLIMKKNPGSLEGETAFAEHPDYCSGCGLCVRVCPEPFALYLKERTEFVFPKKSAVALARQKELENNGSALPEDGGKK